MCDHVHQEIGDACGAQERAEVFRVVHGYLLTRNSRIEEDLVDQLFNSSEKRLARLLLLLANFGKEGVPQPIARRSARKRWPR